MSILRSSLKSTALVCVVAYLLFALPCLAQSSYQTLHNHVPRAISNGQAKRVEPMSATQRLKLSIVLPLRNQADLTSFLTRLNDPSSPDYHHYLSVDQFTDQYGPASADYQAVVAYAQANGLTITDLSKNRLIVPMQGTVHQIEKAFNVKMNTYQHPTEKRTFYSPDREPSLNLNVPVAHIAGLNNYSIPQSMVTKALIASGNTTTRQETSNPNTTGSGIWGAFLPSDIRAAYYTSTLPTGGTALNGSGQSVGLAEFQGSGYYISDVASSFGSNEATFTPNGSNYILTYTPPDGSGSHNININNVLVDGASSDPISGHDVEVVADIVQSIGMAPSLSSVIVYIGYSDVDILNQMASDNIAKQLSISWTWRPDDPSTDDYIFQEFAAQGQSVFVSSGDNGAYTASFVGYYPAEDAWVTTVGGTSLVTSGPGGSWSGETAWPASGGGPSPDGIPIPSWQAGVSTPCNSNNASICNGGSVALRNIPDVAADANQDSYYCDMGICTPQSGYVLGGTSLAAPRWAGFTALINQQAVAAGNSTIGFINPSIYEIGKGSSYLSNFHDIISGNNCFDYIGNATTVVLACFNAVTGYDLVTGWGSPNGQSLINALAPPASPSFQLSASQKSLTINSGATGTTAITVSEAGGFTGSVRLAVTSGLPSGVTASWETNPTTAGSALTLTVSNTAISGSYLVTITGVSGNLTAITTIALDVNAPSFSLASYSGALNLYPGTSASATINVIPNVEAGFSGSVYLAVTSGLPDGVTAKLSANPTTGSSLLTLIASNSVATPISTFVTVTGTSGSLSATATVPVMVWPPNYSLAVSPFNVFLAQGGSATFNVTLEPIGNYTSSLPVFLDNTLPTGVTGTIAPLSPMTPYSTSIVTLYANNTATLGNSYVSVCPSSGGFFCGTADLTVTATPNPTYNLGVSSELVSVVQGSSSTVTVSVNDLNGFSGNVNLCTYPSYDLPSGITVSFSQPSTSTTSTVTVTASSSATTQVTSIPIFSSTGACGIDYLDPTHPEIGFNLIVSSQPFFTLSTYPASLTLSPGASATDTISLIPQPGFNDSVGLSVFGLPSGVNYSFSPASTTGSSVLTLTSTGSAVPANSVITVVGTSGSQTVTTTLNLNSGLQASPDSLVWTTPTVSQGISATQSITITNVSNIPVTFPAPGYDTSISVNSPATLPTDFSVVSDTCAGTIVAPNATCTIGVIFNPQAADVVTTGSNTIVGSINIAAGTAGVVIPASGYATTGPVIVLTSSTPYVDRGGAPTLTATVTGNGATPTGVVRFCNTTNQGQTGFVFFNGGVNCGEIPLANGIASLVTLPYSGLNTVTAIYGEDIQNNLSANYPVGATSTVVVGSGNASSTTPISFNWPYLNWGQSQALDNPTAPWPVTITNQTGYTLTNLQVTVPTGFIITSSTCPPNADTSSTFVFLANCMVNVAFDPTTIGAVNGNLSVQGTNPLCPLNGICSSSLAMQGTGYARLTFNWPWVTLQAAIAGTTTPVGNQWPVTVTNNTGYVISNLAYSFQGVSGYLSGSFSTPNNPCTSLAANSSCTFNVAASPLPNQVGGPYSATLTVGGVDAGGTSDYTVPLPVSSSVIPATYSINWNQDQQGGVSTIDFGPNNAANQTAGPWPITVYNNTPFTETLTLTTSLSVFTTDSSTCTNVASGSACTFNLYFSPTADQVYHGTLTISGGGYNYTFNTWGQANH